MWILANLVGALRGPIAGFVGAVVSTVLLVLVIVLGFKLVGAQHRATKAQAALQGVEAQRDAYKANLGVCTGNTAKLSKAVDDQNASITAAKAAAEEQLRKAQAGIDEAQRDASKREARLRQLLENPPQGKSRCDAADAAIDLAIRQ
jgi:hypothetical protein